MADCSACPEEEVAAGSAATVFFGFSEAGSAFRCCSRSRFEISVSICALNSFEACLNSFNSLPTWRAISGSFFGPKISRARKNRKIVSENPMRFMILPAGVTSNAAGCCTPCRFCKGWVQATTRSSRAGGATARSRISFRSSPRVDGRVLPVSCKGTGRTSPARKLGTVKPD